MPCPYGYVRLFACCVSRFDGLTAQSAFVNGQRGCFILVASIADGARRKEGLAAAVANAALHLIPLIV